MMQYVKNHETSFEPDGVMEFGREPASSCWFAASKLDDRPNLSSNQLGTSFEAASVMEFGFKQLGHLPCSISRRWRLAAARDAV